MLQKNDQVSQDTTADDGDAAIGGRNESGRTATILARLTRGLAQIVLMAVVLGVAFAATMRLVNTKPEVPKRPIFPTVYTVETSIAEIADYQPDIRLYGEVVAARSVDLRALVSGEIVATSDKLKSGGRVAKGDVLLEIDRFDYVGALREAEANKLETEGRIAEADARMRLEESRLKNSRDQLELARNDLQRIQQLRKNGTATQKQVEDRELILSQREQSVENSEINIIAEEARLDQLRAAMDRLEWKIEQSRRNVDSTRLVAPFDGTIRSSTAEVGKLANVNDILVSMYQADQLEARFVLTDEQFGRLQSDAQGVTGRDALVVWNVGGIDYSFPARVDRIGAEIASARGGVEVFATINGGDQSIALRPGAFVEITLPDRKFADHIRLKASSVYNNDTVYVVEDGALVARTVAIASYDGEDVIVGSGLSGGDEVLITRISEISPGLKVRKEGDPPQGRPVSKDSSPTTGQSGSGDE